METKFNYLKSQNAEYIEELYQRYLENPDSIDDSWRFFFEGVELGAEMPEAPVGGNGSTGEPPTAAAAPQQAPLRLVPTPQAAVPAATPTAGPDVLSSEAKVAELIEAYRTHGILLADLNPLEPARKSHPALELSSYTLSETDLDRKFTAAKILGMEGSSTLREIIKRLRETYSSTIGVEYTHIQNQDEREWLETRMEATANHAQLSVETRTRILQKLVEAETFERFLHTRFVGAKRFSVEGGDSLIPMLDCLANEAADLDATDIVLGMAHRGRLNVLANVFGKPYQHIFSEFEGNLAQGATAGEGDVKYHGGYSADFNTTSGRRIHLSLASNPSHLEIVNPVVEGVARAKQHLSGDRGHTKVMPVLIHGDAAFAGQGVVYETMQLSRLRGYNTGGTIHIVANNQVGFTTDPKDSRSTTYATDLAKMLQTPIFHVNGDDPEAAYYVMQLAVWFRQKYHRDIVIDLVCYRKYGHNEGDEPSFTQPLMYKIIKDHASPRELYARRLEAEGALTAEQAQAMLDAQNGKLQTAYQSLKENNKPHFISVFEGHWRGLRPATAEDFKKPVATAVDEKTLREIGSRIGQAPAGFNVHPKLQRLLENRKQMAAKGEGIDWGMGEALAFGSLVWEGTHVRLSGQDAERGTFSHRHSVLYDVQDGQTFVPLNHLKEGQARYSVYNSLLSEEAVLGFDFGYSIADPNSLAIWEAQFGDFTNGAQVVIDQFIASTESKWARMSGLVLLLPHGYEGQGPEHSSARLERFLQLCARENMQVCNFTTPAQLFHALRRQVRRDFRKPLIVMSPKSLLRHPAAVSKLADFSQSGFQEVIDDVSVGKKPRRLLLCTGKIYYELAAARDARSDVAIARVEQLYPWPASQLEPLVKKYSGVKEIFWVQEEPKNMGSWNFVRDHLESTFTGQKISYVGRASAAAPAAGSGKVHEKEQQGIVEEALKS